MGVRTCSLGDYVDDSIDGRARAVAEMVRMNNALMASIAHHAPDRHKCRYCASAVVPVGEQCPNCGAREARP